MSEYIVSARKYRPADFASVIGQTHITTTLKNAIARGQLAHAYLFCGPRGVGKTTCARIFAKAINCLSPHNNEACGACESCRAFDQGRSFSIHELDAASNNSVDDIRTLIDQVRIPPQVGRYSVYIIDEVHMLSAAAFNAFLKTLEEPPAHAIFILATTEKHKIIPTILSRCQIYDFNRIKVDDTVAYLKHIADSEGVTYDDESLHIIAQKADGAMRDALSMFDKVAAFCNNDLHFREVADTLNVLDYDTYFKISDFIRTGDYPQLLLIFDEVLRKGFGGQLFMGGLAGHFRNLLMARTPTTAALLEVTGGVAKRYQEQAQLFDLQQLFSAINLLATSDSEFRTATNQRLLVELTLLKLSSLGQKKNITTDPLPLPQPQTTTVTTETPDTKSIPNTVTAAIPKDSVSEPTPASASARTESHTSPDKPLGVAPVSTPEVSRTPTPTPTSVSVSAPAPAKRTRTPRITDNSSVSGISLNDILRREKRTLTPVDPESEPCAAALQTEGLTEQISAACIELSETLMQERPRLAVAFSHARVEGNRIAINVANNQLRDEILYNKQELQQQIASHIGLNIVVEFDVQVVVDNSFIRPVKLEERFKYFNEKNPYFADLCKRLRLNLE